MQRRRAAYSSAAQSSTEHPGSAQSSAAYSSAAHSGSAQVRTPQSSAARSNRGAVGRAAEVATRLWLEARGLACVTANFRTRRGELDLVMMDGAELVVVEVRYRSAASHGGAAGSVDARKQRRILAATGWLLARRPALARLRLRFDVVTVAGPVEDFSFEWLRDAFRA